MTSPAAPPGPTADPTESRGPRRIAWLDTMSQYISVAKLLVVMVSGGLGYFGVTRVEHLLEDEKFLQSISGYISDLKPVADISCWTTSGPGDAITTRISVRNAGKNVVRLTEIQRQLLDGSSGMPIQLVQDMLPTSDNGMDMDIPPGIVVNSNATYDRATKDTRQIGFQATIEVATSETIMRVAKTVLADRIPNDELEAFGRAKIRCLGDPPHEPPPMPSDTTAPMTNFPTFTPAVPSAVSRSSPKGRPI